MAKTIFKIIVRYIVMTIGAIIGAISVILFMAPFEIAPGGVSGVAVLLNHILNTPIGLMVLLLNIPIQLIGYRMLPGGWRVVVRTIYVLLIYSAAIDLLAPYLPADGLSEDRLLNALFGGISGGIGGGLIYRSGGTFGGTSTLALIVQQRTGTPLSTTFLYTDSLVIGAAGLVFGWEPALYAVVALFVGGLATDYLLEGPSIVRTAMIITNHPDAVSTAIMEELNRGVTAWRAKGMYTGEERWVVYVSLSRSQVQDVRRVALNTDPQAFVVIGQGHAAYGEGFQERNRQFLSGD